MSTTPAAAEHARAVLSAVETIKATGGRVQIAGVVITPCDIYGKPLDEAPRLAPVSLVDLVREFHESFEHPVAAGPTFDVARLRARADWLQEEVDELRAALDAGDYLETVDALLDIAYFALGGGVETTPRFADGFAEVHASNMSKLGLDGKPVRREDGKSMKGPHYFTPDLRTALAVDDSTLCEIGGAGPVCDCDEPCDLREEIPAECPAHPKTGPAGGGDRG